MLMSSMPGFARDFSVTGNGYLVFENRDSERRDLWIAERINLVSGKVERIKEATSPLGPYGWSDGKITWSNLPENTKSRLGTTPMKLVDIQAVSSDNETALAYIVQKSSDSYVALVNSKGEELVATHLPPHTSFSVAGFMP